MLKPKICAYCGKEFIPNSNRQKYCKGPHYGPCPICGKIVEIKDMSTGPQACSEACRQESIRRTTQSRFGVDNVSKLNAVKQKIQTTMQARYGVDHYSKSDEFKAKYSATMNARYGVDYPLQNDKINRKWQDTNQVKYGCPYSCQSESVKQQIADTMQDKFGGFGMASPELRDKIEATNQMKYGHKYAILADEVQAHIHETNLERYGVETVTNNKHIRDKINSANVQKYGSISPLGNLNVQDKCHQTSLKRYGVINPSQSKVVKQKIIQTNIRKYGACNPMQNSDIKKKSQDTTLKRYGTTNWFQSDARLLATITDPTKLAASKVFKENVIKYIQAEYQDNKPTLRMLSDALGVDITTVSKYIIDAKAQDYVTYHQSNMENDILVFLRQLLPNEQIITHDRQQINPYELDLYLPGYRVAIECNPTITHNSTFADPWNGPPKSYRYHKDKSDACEKADIFLFHIFGYEWTHKQEIILSMLRNIFHKTENRIFARNTEVIELSSSECYDFLNSNHRQGNTFAKIRLGLKYGGKIVSVMTFNRVRSTIGKHENGNVWELSRFCNTLNTSVVGGASKLFKYFVRCYHPDKVISFSDRAHAKGELYSKLGFTSVNISNPGYGWVDIKTDSFVNRVNCQKRNLHKLFPNEELDVEHNTERRIMASHGYGQVFDSGTVRWEWVAEGQLKQI